MEFQKFDEGGFISLEAFKLILELNEIEISDWDTYNLSQSGILIKKDNSSLIDYKKLIPLIFVDSSPLYLENMKKAINCIMRMRRILKKKREELMKKKKDGQSLRIKSKPSEKDLHLRGKLKEKSISTKLKEIMPVPKVPKSKLEFERLQKMCSSILYDVVDVSTAFGQSLLLSREIQKRYQNRPVRKDVIVVQEDFEEEVFDVIPQSLCSSRSTARVLWLDNESNLFQYDIGAKKLLKSVYIGTRIPLKITRVVDFVFDSTKGMIFTLNSNWILESWDITQEQPFPVTSVKLILSNEITVEKGTSKIEEMTQKKFLFLSKPSHQILVVNTSSVDNSIRLVDPLSLAVFGQIYMKMSDYKISKNVARVLSLMTGKLMEIQNKGTTFEELFSEGLVEDEGGAACVKLEDFVNNLRKIFLLNVNDLRLIGEFLDQKSDGFISKYEFEYLFDAAKNSVDYNFEISKETLLANLTQTSFNILKRLTEHIKKSNLSLREAFDIFDKEGTGKIPSGSFINLLEKIVGSISNADQSKILSLLDKDGNGSIDYDEFHEIFAVIYDLEEPMIKTKGERLDLNFIFYQLFNAGYDVEEAIRRQDEYGEGLVSREKFERILLEFPIGLDCQEVTELIERHCIFVETGKINYLMILRSPSFQEARLKYRVKMSEKNMREYELLTKEMEEGLYQQSQKLVCDEILFLDEFDLIVYTSASPVSSLIYLTSTSSKRDKERGVAESLENKLLAKLEGHQISYPPLIRYVAHSGCLVSADRLIPREKVRNTSIFIWDLQKCVFQAFDTNPPWKVKPSLIIENAHEHTIFDITYLPSSQLLVSCSYDKTIRFWDAVGRRHELTEPDKAPISKVKVGYYKSPEPQFTVSNKPFGEVKRIYTENEYPCKLDSFFFKLSNPNGGIIELLNYVALGKTQVRYNSIRSTGSIRCLSVSRMGIEIAVKDFEVRIPKAIVDELGSLDLNRRKKLYVKLVSQLPALLEGMKMRGFLHKQQIDLCVKDLRKVSLLGDGKVKEELLSKAFKNLRNAKPEGFNAAEIYQILSNFNFLHPLTITREEFIQRLKVLRHQITDTTQLFVNHFNLICRRISNKILTGQNIIFELKESSITRQRLREFLEKKEILAEVKDWEEFYKFIDPEYLDEISKETLEGMFSSEILQYKLKRLERPKAVITEIGNALKGNSKLEVIFNMSLQDKENTGFITKLEFMRSFPGKGIPIPILEEAFELLSVEFEGERALSISSFSKKIFNSTEKMHVSRVYKALGKLKGNLTSRLYTPDLLFTNVQSGSELYRVTKTQFISRIHDLNIGVEDFDLELMANFLALNSTSDPDNMTITLSTLQHYLRRVHAKDEFILLGNYTDLIHEVKNVLSRENELRSLLKKKDLVTLNELKWALEEFRVEDEIIEELLLRFIKGIPVRLDLNEYFRTLKNFYDKYDLEISTEEPKKMKRENYSVRDLMKVKTKDVEPKRIKTSTFKEIFVSCYFNVRLMLSHSLGKSFNFIQKFQSEVYQETGEKEVDYKDFFTKFLLETEVEREKRVQKKNEPKIDLTALYKRIEKKISDSNVNIHYAVKFVDSERLGIIPEFEFNKLMEWVKMDLTLEEKEGLFKDLEILKKPGFLNIKEFLRKIEISHHEIATTFIEKVWIFSVTLCSFQTVEKLRGNQDFIKFLVGETAKNKKNELPEPLVSAVIFNEALSELSDFFSLKEAELATKFALCGSKKSLEEAMKCKEQINLGRLDITKQVIHLDNFFQGLHVVLEHPEKVEEQMGSSKKGDLSKLTDKERFLIGRINGMLKDTNLSLWDGVLSSSLNIADNNTVTTREFKLLLKIMNLGISFKDKMALINLLDKEQEGNIEIFEFLNLFGSKKLSEKGEQIILEKVATVFYLNDITTSNAFSKLDINFDGKMTQPEFVYSIKRLQVGISAFEANLLGKMIQIDPEIDAIAFKKRLEALFKSHKIDPAAEFSMAIYSKIHLILSSGNTNLLEAFKEIDISKKMTLSYEELKMGFEVFGIKNMKDYELKVLLQSFNPKFFESPSQPIDYASLVQHIAFSLNDNVKEFFDKTNNVVRKCYKMMRMKGVTLLDAFISFDMSRKNMVSKMELNSGLSNLQISLSIEEKAILWNSFEKNSRNQIDFSSFSSRFLSSGGAITLINFDSASEILLKQFSTLVKKLGNYEEAFRKLDKNDSGQISLFELKDAFKLQLFDFNDKEIEKLFKSLSENSQFISYRTFTNTMFQIVSRDSSIYAFSKAHKALLDKNLVWNKVLDPVFPISTLKNQLKKLKLGLTIQEIDLIINYFSDIDLNGREFDRVCKEAYEKIEREKKNEEGVIYGIAKSIDECISKARVSIERLFIDFQTKEKTGLNFSQLCSLIYYLGAPQSKQEVRMLFESIDTQKRGYITCNEMQSFLQESAFRRELRNEKIIQKKTLDNPLSEPAILEKVKERKSTKTFKLIAWENGVNFATRMNEKDVEKILFDAQVVLKKDELAVFNDILSKHFGNSPFSFQDFLDFCQSKQIESAFSETPANQVIHPAIWIALEKITNYFSSLDIGPALCFEYLVKPPANTLTKDEFMILFQIFEISLTRDELLGVYNFFDDKRLGEISKDKFIEKFDFLSRLKATSSDGNKSSTSSLRGSALNTLQKIFLKFNAKGYNKKQIKAFFGDILLSREEFLKAIKALGIDLSLEKIKTLVIMLDRNETGIVRVDEFLRTMFDSVPSAIKSTVKYSQILSVAHDIVKRLKGQLKEFLVELENSERQVKPNDKDGMSSGFAKSAIHSADFKKILREFSVVVSEDEHSLIQSAYVISSNPQYYELEPLYDLFEGFYYGKSDENADDFILWEYEVYRKIAEKLREQNSTIEQLFTRADSDGDNLLLPAEYKKIISGLGLEYSEKQLEKLIGSFGKVNDHNSMISLKSFKTKFWAAYTASSFGISGNLINQEFSKQTSSNKKLISLLHSIVHNQFTNADNCFLKIDKLKKGFIELDDFVNTLYELKIFLTKRDVCYLFEFLDANKDQKVSYFDIIDFFKLEKSWEQEQENESDFNETVFEDDVLEHLGKILNRSKKSLWELFEEFALESQGCISQAEFGILLKKVGVRITDNELDKLFALLAIKNTHHLTYAELESKLIKRGVSFLKSSDIEKVTFIDKSLLKFSKILVKLDFEGILRRYDEDLDGILRPQQLHLALQEMNESMYEFEIQRIVHKMKDFGNKVKIERFVNFVREVASKREMSSEIDSLTTISQDLFEVMINNFDGFNRMFNLLSQFFTSLNGIKDFLHLNLCKLRSLKLLATQIAMKSLFEEIDDCFMNLDLFKTRVEKAIHSEIYSTFMKLIDHRLMNPEPDKLGFKEAENRLRNTVIPKLTDISSFQIDVDSFEFQTPFIKKYDGTDFREKKRVELLIYPKDTLRLICGDGALFEKHLENEIKARVILSDNGIVFPILGIYEKQLGIDSSEKEIHIISEKINSEDWIRLDQFIGKNGGILRMPFLMKTNAVTLLTKFWGEKLLRLIRKCETSGVIIPMIRPEFLYISTDGKQLKLYSATGATLFNQFGKVTMIPDQHIFIPGSKISSLNPENNSFRESQSDIESTIQSHFQVSRKSGYIAPELLFKPKNELTNTLDSWAFGSLMYYILFGREPPSSVEILEKKGDRLDRNFKEVSDYFLYELFSVEMRNRMFEDDYGVRNEEGYASASEAQSFGGLFRKLMPKPIPTVNTKSISKYLDMIAACLSFNPHLRPTCESLLSCELFGDDIAMNRMAEQYAEALFFYKSPGMTLRDKFLLPMRDLCGETIKSPKSLLKHENTILTCLNQFHKTILEEPSKALEEIVKKQTEKETRKPDQALIKYIFDENMLDLIVFLVLSHHGECRKRNYGDESVMQSSWKLLIVTKEIFKVFFDDLQSHESSVKPYLFKLIPTFCKLFVGEEYECQSDCIDRKNKMIVIGKEKERLMSGFMRESADGVEDKTDKLWRKHSGKTHLTMRSQLWSPMIFQVFGPLYKESITESGVGKSGISPLQEYLQECNNIQKIPEYKLEKKVNKLGDYLGQKIPKGSDYYMNIYSVMQNLCELETGTDSKSSLKVALTYIKSLVKSKSLDKIKVILDSRLPFHLTQFLISDILEVRTDVLEFFYELSISVAIRKSEENFLSETSNFEKFLGIVTHLNIINEDKLDKKRYLDCTNNYFAFFEETKKVYLNSIAECFQSPLVISNIFQGLKEPTTKPHNKILMLRTFANLIHAPCPVLLQLRNASIDVFQLIFKLLALKSHKAISSFIPLVLEVFSEIEQDCRPELIRILEMVPGIRSLLKDQNLIFPKELSLSLIEEKIESCELFYIQESRKIIQEIKENFLSENKKIIQLQEKLRNKIRQVSRCLLNWLRFYLKPKVSDLALNTKRLFERFSELAISVIKELLPFAQESILITEILYSLGSFIQESCELGYEFLFFNSKTKEFSEKFLSFFYQTIRYSYGINIELEEELQGKTFGINKNG